MDATLEDRLRQFVALGSGLAITHVVPGQEQVAGGKVAPAPTGPYASLTLVDDYPVGSADRVQISTATRTRVQQMRRADYSLQFYRDRGPCLRWLVWLEGDLAVLQEQLHKFRVGRPVRAMEADAIDRGVASVSGAKDRAGGWETRVVCSLSVGYTAQLTEDTGRIDSIPWTAVTVHRTERGTWTDGT